MDQCIHERHAISVDWGTNYLTDVEDGKEALKMQQKKTIA